MRKLWILLLCVVLVVPAQVFAFEEGDCDADHCEAVAQLQDALLEEPPNLTLIEWLLQTLFVTIATGGGVNVEPPWHVMTNGADDLKVMARAQFGEVLVDSLSDQVWINVWDAIETDFARSLDAARNGIASVDAMATYMKDEGVLLQLPFMTKIWAKNLMNGYNLSNTYLTPASPVTPGPLPEIARLPAEWDPVEAIQITWPMYYHPTAWKGHKELVKAVRQEASVYILVPNQYWHRAVLLYLDRHLFGMTMAQIEDNVRFMYIETDWTSAMDYSQVQVEAVGGEVVSIGLDYHIPWFPIYPNDHEVAELSSEWLGQKFYEAPFIAEYGAFTDDGNGTVFMNDGYVYKTGYTQEELEDLFGTYLGAERVLFPPSHELDFVSHVGTTMRFIDEERVLVAQCGIGCVYKDYFNDVAEWIGAIRSDNGNGDYYEVIRQGIPFSTAYDLIGLNQHSYVGGYFLVNDLVIVPTYANPLNPLAIVQDIATLLHYGVLFPGKTIKGIYWREWMSISPNCSKGLIR